MLGVKVRDCLKVVFCLSFLFTGSSQIGVAAEPSATESHATTEEAPKASQPEASNPLWNLLFPKEADYNLPPVQPKLDMFLWTLVLFVAFIFVMRALAWDPLIQGLNDREARVIKTEQNAEAALREAQQLRAESEARLAAVHDQIKSVMAEARAEADAQKREILAQAEQESKRVRDEALQAIREAQETALQSLDQQVEEQVALATEHVVGRSL